VFLRPIVVVEAFKVEHILAQLVLEVVPLLFFLGQILVSLFLQDFIFVAIVVAACFLSVFLPRTQAHPTETMRADSALHVVATLVLFNWFLAFGTVFGVGHDPGDVFRLSAVLQHPFLAIVTRSRSVGFFTAFPTKRISAFANNKV